MCMYLIDMFQVSYKAIQPNKHGLFVVVVVVVIVLCLFVYYRLFSCCCIYVVVYFRHRKGKPGRIRRGVREGVSRVDSQPLDQPKITLLYLYCVYLSLFCGFGMGSYLPREGKGGLVGLGRGRYIHTLGGWMVFGE